MESILAILAVLGNALQVATGVAETAHREKREPTPEEIDRVRQATTPVEAEFEKRFGPR